VRSILWLRAMQFLGIKYDSGTEFGPGEPSRRS
jgi:hypothetical protein